MANTMKFTNIFICYLRPPAIGHHVYSSMMCLSARGHGELSITTSSLLRYLQREI